MPAKGLISHVIIHKHGLQHSQRPCQRRTGERFDIKLRGVEVLSSSEQQVLRFEDYEFDLKRLELRRQGKEITLAPYRRTG
jgi:DNA-binding response OmpR family regulator